jgi:hypothetical protein
VDGEQPPNVKKPITSSTPAVVLRRAGSRQVSQTAEAHRALVAADVPSGGSHSFMLEDRYFLGALIGDGAGL